MPNYISGRSVKAEAKITEVTPRLPVGNPAIGRPSSNLGYIFNGIMDTTTVNLFSNILPSNTLPFSVVRPPDNKKPLQIGRLNFDTQVPLAGSNLRIPASIPTGLLNNPNFTKLSEQIRNTRSVFTRTRVATALSGVLRNGT